MTQPGPGAAPRGALSYRAGAVALALAAHLALWAVYGTLAALNSVLRDAGAFLLSGRMFVDGAPLYQGVWDHKGPIVYLLNAAGTVLTPRSIAGVLLLEAGMVTAALAAFQRSFWRRAPVWAALVSAAGAASFLVVHEGGDLTETLAFPWQLVAYVLFWRLSVSRPRFPLAAHAFVGASVAWCVLLRPNTGIGVALVAAALAVAALRARDHKPIAALVMGAAAVAVPILAVLAVSGSMRAFVDQYFVYNIYYSAKASFAKRLAAAAWLAVHDVARMPMTFLSIALLPAAVGAARSFRATPWWGAVLLAAFAADCLAAAISGNVYGHYVVTLIPAWMVLCGLAWEFLPWARPARWSTRGVLAALAGAAVLSAGVRVAHELRAARAGGAAERRVVKRIRSLSGPDDALLVYGAEPKYNFLAGRWPPTEYAYQFALLTPGYGTAARVSRFFDEVRSAAPLLILDAHTAGFCPLAQECPPADGGTLLSDVTVLADFRAWVARHYVADDSLEGVRIFRRRTR